MYKFGDENSYELDMLLDLVYSWTVFYVFFYLSVALRGQSCCMLLIKTEVFEVFNHFIQTNPINTLNF